MKLRFITEREVEISDDYAEAEAERFGYHPELGVTLRDISGEYVDCIGGRSAAPRERCEVLERPAKSWPWKPATPPCKSFAALAHPQLGHYCARCSQSRELHRCIRSSV